MLRRLLENVLFRAQTGLQRHDDGLTERINGRVGDLREFLPEVIRHMAHLAGQNRHRGIVPHGTDRLLGTLSQWAQHLVPLFKRDIEHLLMNQKLFGFHQLEFRGRLIQRGLDSQCIVLEPALVGLGFFEPLVDIPGMQDLAGFGIDGQHLTRANPSLGDHIVR